MGAVPNTRWVAGCLALDGRGFIKTGPDLSRDDLAGAHCSASARDERSRHLCGRRRARRKRQAGCVRGWRGLDCSVLRASSPARVTSADLDHARRRRSNRADQRRPTRVHERTERPYDGKTKAPWERDMILAKRIMDKGTANHILVSEQVA